MPREHVQFVTGRLAEFSLRKVLEQLAPLADFDFTVDVLPITVAALMTPEWIARRVAEVPAATKILVPGYCGGDLQPDPEAEPAIIGTDDCEAGTVCVNNVCQAICQGDEACGEEAACVGYGDLFTDNEDVGACSPLCDPIAQNCGEERGCYVNASPGNGWATCEEEIYPERTQGAECPAGSCSINGCAASTQPVAIAGSTGSSFSVAAAMVCASSYPTSRAVCSASNPARAASIPAATGRAGRHDRGIGS